MLEKAYKYVRYLEAQVLALLTMRLCTLDERCVIGGGTGETERRLIESMALLSRKELVEAVVNSGTAQKVMYEEGLCLVSEEQVRFLAWSCFQKQQQEQLSVLIGAAKVGNNNNNADTVANNNRSSSCCSYPSSCSYSYS
ncbi:hypothetical protein MLD38_009139 [Melastoma candidum]|nr:hypothetical protein MLD38_009139 [Melastoma candidum]